jgi:hypothetical protein
MLLMNASAAQLLLALLMAVPLHLCCWTGLMKTEDAAACSACHQFLTDEERSAESAPPPPRHCECCDDTLQRDLTPSAIAAPRPLLSELPLFTWVAPEHLLQTASVENSPRQHVRDGHSPPAGYAPLYQRYCALLL